MGAKKVIFVSKKKKKKKYNLYNSSMISSRGDCKCYFFKSKKSYFAFEI